MQHRLEVEYIPLPLKSSICINSLISFHYYQYAPTYAGLVERHDFWEMVYADSGSIICRADGKEVKLSQGQAIFHPPMEEHSVVALGSSGNACILAFACPDLDPHLFKGRVLALSRQERDLVGAIYAEGRKLFEPPYNAFVQAQLKRRADAPFGCEQALRNALESLMISLMRNLIASPSSGGTEPERRTSIYRRTHFDAESITQKVIEYLRENIHARLTLQDIGAALSFSGAHLQRIFKKQVGMSIIQYFNHMKIEEAKRRIAEGQYTYTQIAGLLGFSSIHYFSRVFKLHARMSPNAYEKSVRMPEPPEGGQKADWFYP
jgi:AraC-like DNA-binding protein